MKFYKVRMSSVEGRRLVFSPVCMSVCVLRACLTVCVCICQVVCLCATGGCKSLEISQKCSEQLGFSVGGRHLLLSQNTLPYCNRPADTYCSNWPKTSRDTCTFLMYGACRGCTDCGSTWKRTVHRCRCITWRLDIDAQILWCKVLKCSFSCIYIFNKLCFKILRGT